MKFFAFVLDIVVLLGLIVLMIVCMGDTYTHGGIVIKSLLMGAVGAVYGVLRSIYRKWLFSEDKQD